LLSALSMICVSARCSDNQLRPSPSSVSLPSEFLLNRLHHEVHESDVVRHAVQLQAPVQLLRMRVATASRVPRPSPSDRLLLRRRGGRPGPRRRLRRRRTVFAFEPEVAAAPLFLRCLLGNGLWRTTWTTGRPLSAPLADDADRSSPSACCLRHVPATTGSRNSLPAERGPDYGHEASLSRHRALLAGAKYTNTRSPAKAVSVPRTPGLSEPNW